MVAATAAGAAVVASGAEVLDRATDVPVADASNHRSAPAIAFNPAANATDLYAFVSPDKPSTATIIANYIPFESPDGGPNYYRFAGNVLYEIKIDNNGDAKEEITYQFAFATNTLNPNTFLYNTGPVASPTDPNLNVQESVTVAMIDASGNKTVLGKNLPVAPVNIGPKSMPNYDAIAAAAINTLSDGSKLFCGPRADPFFIDLGAVFDLLTIRKLPGNAGGGVNALTGYNIHTITLQVPITTLAGDHKGNNAKDGSAVIGVWTNASALVPVVDSSGNVVGTSAQQISRLGSPLVNELVIPRGKKNGFNASVPANDAQYLNYVTDPEPAKLLNALYKINVPPAPRDDLVAIFLTGVKGLNQPTNITPSEQLRLNLAIPPSATPNRLGVLGGDVAGFPNGRRLADDIVDASLQAVAGAAYPLFHPGFTPDPLAGKLGDGVDGPARPFTNSFPYLATPYRGYEYSGGEAVAGAGGGAAGGGGGGAELGASQAGTLAGNAGGAYATFTISSPTGKAVNLKLTFSPADANLAPSISLEVYQNGKLASAQGSGNTGSIALTVTPSASGGPVQVKVGNYATSTISYTLTMS